MPVAHIIFLFKKGSPFIPAAAISLLPPYLVLLLCSRTPIWPLCGTIKAEPQAGLCSHAERGSGHQPQSD